MITAESHAQGVLITVTVAGGVAWTVSRADGFTVRGGSGVGAATFIDAAAPVNEPVTYLLESDSGTGQATATRAGIGHMLTSINGLSCAHFRWLGDADSPVSGRGFTSEIPGRRHSVVRLDASGVEDSVTVTARCAGADNLVMRELLLVNRPMLLFHDRSRCEIPDCDIPAVECVTNVGRVQNSRTRHVRATTRDWDLDLLPIDLPDSQIPVGVSMWEQGEAEVLTWTDVELMGMPWTEFETGAWIND